MADIHIHREHRLGLAKARKIAWKWAEDAEKKFGMECTVIEGETSDTVEFTRAGVERPLLVAADRFDLNARLGLLLGAFSRRDRGRDREEPRRAARPGRRQGKKARARKAPRRSSTGRSRRSRAALLERFDQVDVLLHRLVAGSCP